MKRTRIKRTAPDRLPDEIRLLLIDRDDATCVRCGQWLGGGQPYSAHHRLPGQMGGSEGKHMLCKLLILCGDGVSGCHGWVESHRTFSYAEGYLVPRHQDPEQWPVLRLAAKARHLRRWEQPGELWTPAQPHPEQVAA